MKARNDREIRSKNKKGHKEQPKNIFHKFFVYALINGEGKKKMTCR